jgi:hypothetical protein
MMGRLRVIHGTPPPDTPAEQVRQRMRKMRATYTYSCSSCGGSEYITARCGNVHAKLCVICLTQGRRREMDAPSR